VNDATVDLSVLCGLAANPAASESLLERLTAAAQHRSALARALLTREHLPAPIARDLAGHRDIQVRLRVAGHPGTPEDVWRTLAGDPEPTVRAAVAAWPRSWVSFPRERWITAAALPAEIYRDLATDPVPAVRAALGRNSRIPEAIRMVLADDADPEVRRCAALGALPTQVLHRLMRDPDCGVRTAALMTAAVHAPTATIPLPVAEVFHDDRLGSAAIAIGLVELTPPLLERLWALPGLRRSLAGNPSFPAERMSALVTDPDPQVRAGLAENPRLAPSILEELVATMDAEVHRELLRRTDLPDRLLRRLVAADEDDEPLPLVNALL
jgi:hypothetical protein